MFQTTNQLWIILPFATVSTSHFLPNNLEPINPSMERLARWCCDGTGLVGWDGCPVNQEETIGKMVHLRQFWIPIVNVYTMQNN